MKLDIHFLFSAHYAKWIIIGLISLLSILIIFEWATLFYPITSAPLTQTLDSKPVASIKQGHVNYILNASLFGVYVPADLNEDNVKESLLNVTLVGILFADKMEESQVIIRSASGEEKTYNIGDKIPGGAIIKRIMPSGVLVERNGTLESLSLPKNDLTFEPIAKPLKEE
ncbi:general secretion pathway protein GspC [Legionella norrlandica]|uniref:General secretion pathway protein GspC n=1 Tax=Legionella norrlandica TaxID=1498499 RepID=A0A0A2SXF2_9GAMM|nr:type II secretion system protein N [Legionella norrlandica]KGP64134.1 general secretion pathway protein GspC [Legionella norrlandica]